LNDVVIEVSKKGNGGGMIQVKSGAQIENPREYGCGPVEHLRHLLALGSPAQRDPNRENFYEIEGMSESYYIHISPLSGNVVLLARWLREPEDCCLSSGRLAA
jgi:hypothetical protein